MTKSNVKRIRTKMSFTRMHGNELVSRATAVGNGVFAHPEAFPDAPVDGPTLKGQTAAYGAAYAEALEDGGKKTVLEKNKQESALVDMLRKLARYVEIALQPEHGNVPLKRFRGRFPVSIAVGSPGSTLDH